MELTNYSLIEENEELNLYTLKVADDKKTTREYPNISIGTVTDIIIDTKPCGYQAASGMVNILLWKMARDKGMVDE